MLRMSPAGACTPSRASPPSAEALACHDFGDGVVLRMWATPVAAACELASAELVVHPLPLPFGRHLLLGPATFALAGGKALNAKRWEELLGRLRDAKTERPQTVLLAPKVTTGTPGDHDDHDHDDHDDGDGDDDDGLSEYECGEGENDEGEHDDEQEEDDDDDEEDDEL